MKSSLFLEIIKKKLQIFNKVLKDFCEKHEEGLNYVFNLL